MSKETDTREGRSDASRYLKSRHVVMIAFGGIIGAGLFVGSSAAILRAGPGVIVSYILAGLIVLMIMRMLGEMAVADPGRGTFVEYIRKGMGDWAGFTSGWLYWFFWLCVVAIEAIVATEMIQAWVPAPTWLMNTLLIGSMMVTNLVSTKAYGEFEFWFASLKVMAIIVFAILCVSYIAGVTGPGPAVLANVVDHGGFFPNGISSVFAAIPAIFFAFTGSEIASVAAAESDAPARNVARAANTVTLRILLFYVVSIILIVTIVPWSSLKAGASPFVAAMGAMGIPGADIAMKFIVLTAVLSCLNSGIYVASRALQELSRSGHAPLAAGQLNARHVPYRAVIFSAGLGLGMSMLNTISMESAFTFLLNASGTLVLFIYVLVALAQIRQRRRHEQSGAPPLQFRMWAFPLLSYLTIAVIVAILGAMLFVPGERIQVVLSTCTLLLVVAIYMVFFRGKQRAASKSALSSDGRDPSPMALKERHRSLAGE